MKEIEKAYEAKKYEDDIYKKWEESGAFTPKIIKGKKPFVISMPPPNATGVLHLGHAEMLAIEDMMVRFKRMQGYPSLWLPGTDHASIATQNKVEKIIAEEGETRHTMGRERFLQRVNGFVKESRHIIRNQIRKMGSSCDWSRERYTLDDGLVRAVQEVFVKMYEDGLIYRGNRIVNWCTRCSSTLADDEVVFKEEKTRFYYIKYGPVIIGTARPETKFLDKIIVAHPDDKRYKKYFGKNFRLPWIEGDIDATFIADKSADPDFGSGAMTLTPAHDFIDFEIARKRKLEIVQIIGPDGNFTDVVGPRFAGKNARDSRPEIVRILEEKDLLDRVEDNYVHNLSVCYRCGTPIEPLVSSQWFIDVNKPVFKGGGKSKSLKQKAIEVVKKGEIEIIPERFNKIYFNWMNDLRDWCISRQIWFGHRIPVWYCAGNEGKPACPQPIVQAKRPERCPHCRCGNLRQDPDTLDTWFSSGLWTFSTLGWPDKTNDLKYFHPTSVLETGYDIIFFWVARMILMTTYALRKVPFRKVYLHGLVRDRHGKKMSKSSGNGIDPLDMIDKFGTDAVRLSFIIGTSPGNDFRLYEEKIAGYRNFVNKIWNSARFALLNLPENSPRAFSAKDIKSPSDKWIVSRLQKLVKDVTSDMEKFNFSDAGTKIYDFTWGEYCDWYLEMSKGSHMNPPVLLYVLKNLLKLLHPFVPFVTEAVWSHLGEKEMLIGDKWPKYDGKLVFRKEEKEMETVQQLITSIRSIRAEKGVEAGRKINAIIYGEKWTSVLEQKRTVIERMARIGDLKITKTGPKVTGAIWSHLNGIDLYLPAAELFDINHEKVRLDKKMAETSQKMQSLKTRLDNPNFTAKAPPELVQREKALMLELEKELSGLQNKLNELNSL
jgi:valyl-tRNA synthetase